MHRVQRRVFGGTATPGCARTAFRVKGADTERQASSPACARLTTPMTFYRRNLPHWQPDAKSIFLTWRLFGSLPRSTGSFASRPGGSWGKRFLALDSYLDSTDFGPRWLADPEIAGFAEGAILRGTELGHYELHAYVIMPNHVHVLLQPRAPLARITNGIKGVSARDANAVLGRVGQHFWQDESFDHWIRSFAGFERARHYIEWNPVKAKLVAAPQEWKWSSANRRVQSCRVQS